MKEAGLTKVKSPYVRTLDKILRGKKDHVTRVEKGYFVGLMNREQLRFLEFNGLEVKANTGGNGHKAGEKKRFTWFDLRLFSFFIWEEMVAFVFWEEIIALMGFR